MTDGGPDHALDATSIDALDGAVRVDATDGTADSGPRTDAVDSMTDLGRLLDTADATGDDVRAGGTPDTTPVDACAAPSTVCEAACVNTSTDPHHCGGCAVDCTMLPNVTSAVACAVGTCSIAGACARGFADCDLNRANGCETSLSMTSNCGACGTTCADPTPVCSTASDGTSVCASGCSGATSARCAMMCVDTQSNPAFCGSCTNACPVPANASATCTAGACGIACNAGYTLLGGACVSSCTACEATATPITSPGGRFTRTTSGSSNYAGSCGGGMAPETVYKLILTVASDVFVTTHGTPFDSVVYMRSACCNGAEVACNDNADGRSSSVLSQRNLAPGTYYLFVDGASAAAAGAYTVDIYATPASSVVADACGSPSRLVATARGTNCGFGDDFQGSCSVSATGGPDAVYYLVLDRPSSVTIDTCSGSTCIDTMLYVRSVCTNAVTEACNDDACRSPGTCYAAGAANQSRLTVSLPAGVHYLVLDQYEPNPSGLPCGAYTITATGVPP